MLVCASKVVILGSIKVNFDLAEYVCLRRPICIVSRRSTKLPPRDSYWQFVYLSEAHRHVPTIPPLTRSCAKLEEGSWQVVDR